MLNTLRRKFYPALFAKVMTNKFVGKISALSSYRRFDGYVEYDVIALEVRSKNGAVDTIRLQNVAMLNEGSSLIQSLIGQSAELAVVSGLTFKPTTFLCAVKQENGTIHNFPILGIKLAALGNTNELFMPHMMNWAVATIVLGTMLSIVFIGFCIVWVAMFKARFNMDPAFSAIWSGALIATGYVKYNELLGFPLKLHRQIKNAVDILK